MTRIYLIRHAEPNLDNHDDALRELSEKGLRDRERVTEFLSDKHIDAVLSSPYRRAAETVAHFAHLHGLEIITVDDFRERKVGSGWIDDFPAFAKRQWGDRFYSLPEGECLNEVRERNLSALNRVLKEYAGKNIAIGGHGTAICTVINHFDSRFGYEDFTKLTMPWIAELVFDDGGRFAALNKYAFE